MAGFKGMRWASTQLRYDLTDRESAVRGADDRVPAVSRSLHYGLCLAFEGIRFRCRLRGGQLTFTFLNLDKNVARFRRSIAYNLPASRSQLVPTPDELRDVFLGYLSLPDNRALFEDMARTGQQGYLRPFTVDEDQSIGVTFPQRPTLRLVAAGYDDYMGEPFSGVVVPQLVRAVAANGTGCLKLGVNYLMSVKAVEAAQAILPTAASALFLDDHPEAPIETRPLSEWDSSCALIALTDGSFLKIPESPLILPSVTIGGICSILRAEGHEVVERDVTFGELAERTAAREIVTVASIGTAGILNRCDALHLFDGERVRDVLVSTPEHPAFAALGAAKQTYQAIYAHEAAVPEGHVLEELEALA